MRKIFCFFGQQEEQKWTAETLAEESMKRSSVYCRIAKGLLAGGGGRSRDGDAKPSLTGLASKIKVPRNKMNE